MAAWSSILNMILKQSLGYAWKITQSTSGVCVAMDTGSGGGEREGRMNTCTGPKNRFYIGLVVSGAQMALGWVPGATSTTRISQGP